MDYVWWLDRARKDARSPWNDNLIFVRGEMYSRRSISIASCWNESIFIRSKKWVPIRRRRSIDVVELLLFLTLICGPFSRHASLAFLLLFFIPSFNVSINLFSFCCSIFLFRILTFRLLHVINMVLWEKKEKENVRSKVHTISHPEAKTNF